MKKRPIAIVAQREIWLRWGRKALCYVVSLAERCDLGAVSRSGGIALRSSRYEAVVRELGKSSFRPMWPGSAIPALLFDARLSTVNHGELQALVGGEGPLTAKRPPLFPPVLQAEPAHLHPIKPRRSGARVASAAAEWHTMCAHHSAAGRLCANRCTETPGGEPARSLCAER